MTLQASKQRIRNPEPNPAQLQAIVNLQDDLLVAAGAGSGKTWVLTERYMEMLVHDTRPSQIVAITFTELAASEMKRRIRSAVQQLLETADPSAKTYWRQVYNELDTAIVSTIHGFCMRLLKEHPVEAGIDPLAEVLEPDEAERLLEQAAHELLEETMRHRFEQLQPFYLAWGGRRWILETLLQAYEMVRTFEYPMERIISDTERSLAEMQNRIRELTDRIDTLVRSILMPELAAVQGNSKKKLPQYVPKMEGWIHHWEQRSALLRSWDGTVDTEVRQTLRDLVKTMWGKYGTESVKDAHEEIKSSLNQLIRLEIAPDTLHRVRVFGELIESLADRYQQKKKERYALDFHDLEGLTAHMLENHPDVAETYRKRLRFIMIDEFQDTNRLQKSIIDRIVGSSGEVKRFLVGDGKQSIYKFRGADVDVFQEVEEEHRSLGENRLIDMGINFRTQAGIINYINDFFAQLMQGSSLRHARQVRFAPLQAARNPQHVQPCVEILVHAGEEEEDSRDGEAQRIALRIRELVDRQAPVVYRKEKGAEQETPRPVQYGDIAILFSATTHLPVYERALQRFGIPYAIEKGRQFYKKQEITDLFVWLLAIADPTDEVALTGLLRSPVFALSDETLFWLAQDGSIRENLERFRRQGELLEFWQERLGEVEYPKTIDAARQLDAWRKRFAVHPLLDGLRNMLEESGYLQVLLAQFGGEQRYANVCKLLEIAEELQREEGYGLEEFVEHLKRMREDEVQETEAQLGGGSVAGGAVRLMTVHASKGLEFPVVFLPDLKRKMTTNDAGRCLIRPGIGMGLKAERYGDSADDGKLDVQGDGLFLLMRDQEKEREELEEQRKLYVAMTRARDYLILSVSKPKVEQASWQKWILTHLACKFDELPAGTMEKGNPAEGTGYQLFINHELPLMQEVSDKPQKPWQIWRERWMKRLPDESASRQIDGSDATASDLMFPVGDPDSIQLPMLSASAYMAYRTCERRFYYRYLFQLPELRRTGQDAAFAGELLPDLEEDVSAAFHGEISARASGEDGRGIFMSEEGKREPLRRLYADVRGTLVHELFETLQTPEEKSDLIHRHVQSMPGLSGRERRAFVEYLEQMTDRYLNSPWFRPDSLREQSFYLRIGSTAGTTGRSTLLHGFIDLILTEPDGSVTVVDFKTNEIQSEEQLAELAVKYTVQLQLYALGAAAVLQKPVKRAVLFFLDTDQAVDVDVSPQALAQLADELQQTCTRLEQGITIEAYPMTEQQAACRKCGYCVLCGRNEGIL